MTSDTAALAAPVAPSWARRWRARAAATRLLHSSAVILDVETTGLDGRICEIAVIDTTGRVLLDTLVNPKIPVPAEAAGVHGITDADLATAPTWAELAGELERLLAGRTVIAYNAPFDQGRLQVEQDRAGYPSPRRWWCLMRARAAVEAAPWRALHGGHRAAGDCQAALAVLEDLAVGPPRRRRPL